MLDLVIENARICDGTGRPSTMGTPSSRGPLEQSRPLPLRHPKAVRAVFVDTVYWIAVVRPFDQWKQAAADARQSIEPFHMVTSDEVLTEFLAALSAGGDVMRRQASRMVRAILDNPNVTVVPQFRDAFLRALDLYEQRPDKEYSLTDRISMNIMKRDRIADVLTIDHHFQQEGFQVLMRR